MTDASLEQRDIIRATTAWGIGLAGGLVAGIVIGWLFGLGTTAGIIFGAVIFVVLPWVLPGFAEPSEPPVPHAAPAVKRYEAPATAAAPAAASPVAAPAAATPAASDWVEPVAAPVAPAAAPVTTPIAAPGTPPVAEAAPLTGEAAISERVREAARAAGELARSMSGEVATGQKPAGFDAPRDGGADDLQKIKGVGPKLEGLLHDLGVFHFDQIAAWGDGEVAWVDAHLEGFSGRAVRDDWVGQAKLLAAGGTPS